MEAVAAIPPFERFYEERRDEIFGYLTRLLGREAAEDAFQETFLRALRSYGKLEHGRHLRAWVFTIATRVAVDVRRPWPWQQLLDELDEVLALRVAEIAVLPDDPEHPVLGPLGMPRPLMPTVRPSSVSSTHATSSPRGVSVLSHGACTTRAGISGPSPSKT